MKNDLLPVTLDDYPKYQGGKTLMNQTLNLTRSKELAEAHWKDYVKGLLEATGVDRAIVNACEFVYISSFIHGYKHAMQDMENSKKIFSEYNVRSNND